MCIKENVHYGFGNESRTNLRYTDSWREFEVCTLDDWYGIAQCQYFGETETAATNAISTERQNRNPKGEG